jgi:hypothetical protein
MTPIIGLLAFVFLIAWSGRRPTRGTYAAVALGAILLAIWEYLP